jgi:transcriptional regulator with XRE-family HTH domain
MTGRELRARRRALEVTQAELCRKAGIRWSLLSAIEREAVIPEAPSCDELARVCKGIALDKLGRALAEIDEQEQTAAAAAAAQ